MKSIDHLPESEKKHFIKCTTCQEYVDMRDLEEILYHDTGDCLTGKPKQKIPFDSSRKVGDPEEFLNDDDKTKIDLN